MKSSSKSASESFRDKRETSKARKEERAQLKAERSEEKRERKNKKDCNKKMSKMLVIFLKFRKIMTYLFTGTVTKKIKAIVHLRHVKAYFDHEANSSEITSNSQDIKQSDNKGNVSSSNEDNDNDSSNAEGSISEAGEVANVEYVVPPLSLLNQPAKQQSTSKAEVQRKGQVLESTMKNFGVNAKVTQIKIGPAVTQYEVQPAQGVKVSKIVNLHNDIALALAAKDVRIEAPIPGRSAVGIEVPNDKISLVSLKEVLEEKFPSQHKLEVGIGRDISGEPVSIQLNEMPHLLVAGSTGSGKSVCINGIITSIYLMLSRMR